MNELPNLQETKQKNKQKNLIALIVGVAAFLIVGVAVFFFAKKTVTDTFSNDKVTTELQAEADRLNATLPEDMGDGMRLDKVELQPKHTFVYYFTCTDFDSETEPFDTDLAREAVLSELRGNPAVKPFLLMNVTIGYKYYDKNQKFITEFKFTPEMYK